MKLTKGLWGTILLLFCFILAKPQDSTSVGSTEKAPAPTTTTDKSEDTAPEKEEEEEDSDAKKMELPFVTLNFGLMNYKGDIGEVKELGSVENMELGASLHIEYIYKNLVGAELYGIYGFVSQNERSRARNVNFRTGIAGGGLNLQFRLDNGFIMAEDADIGPFLFGGIGFVKFSPRTDLVGADGPYYYWSDGSIKDLPEGNDAAVETKRDYIYETDLSKDSSYSTTTLIFPVGIGADFKVAKWLDAQARISYNFTTTDYLDNTPTGNQNDAFLYGSLGFKFNITQMKKSGEEDAKKAEYDDIDFKALLAADEDADGVPDIEDLCPDTDEGIKVNKVGCPMDKDNDGIPDHLDKDNETATGQFVDTSGIAIPDSVFEQKANDTIVTLREELCLYYPSMCKGDETEIEFQILNTGKADKSLIHSQGEASKKSIEEIMKMTDTNKDGKTDSKEIYEAIDAFFEGKLDIKLGDIHKLIDHFFDQ